MRVLLLGLIFSSSILLAIVAQRFDEDEYGDNDFDSDLFWIGSNVPSVGRPKFKITEHPDGYSMQIGFTGYYMRIRYTDSDNSLDFNIMGYKGSVKYKLNYGNYEQKEFEGTFEVVGSKKRTWWSKNVDAKIKAKYSLPRRLEPMNLEFSFVNNFKKGENNHIDMPSKYIKNAEDVEVHIRMSIDPRNWAETTMNFEMNAKGDMYRETYGSDWDNSWSPGSYNLSASLAVTKLEGLDDYYGPNRDRQPKMTAALDLEEDVTFDEQVEDVPRSQKLLKKSVLIDGMINLTGQGTRLAVVKLTDAENKKSIGRMQVRRPDDENYKLEMFMNGAQFAAVNMFQNIDGVTNITVEESGDCPEATYNFYEVSNTTDIYNNTEYDDASLDYNYGNETFLNYTDTNVTNYDAEENTMDLWDSCKRVNRVLDSVSGDGVYESRVYNDIFYMGGPSSYRDRYTEGEKGLIYGCGMAQKNETYEGHMMFGSRWNKNIMHCKLDNDGIDTNMEMGTSQKRLNGRDEYVLVEGKKINVDITKGAEEKDINMKLRYNNERIFDGWFYLSELIHRYARENVPAMINRQLESFQDAHAEQKQRIANLF